MGFGIGLAHDPARARVAPGGPSVARPVAAFVLSGLAALALVTVLGAFAVDRLATEEAVRDARGLAAIMATGIVEPAIPEGLVAGDAAAVDALDAVVRARVLDDSIVRVKVWDAAARSSTPTHATRSARRYVLGDDAREALATGAGHAELSNLTRPENASEQGLAPVLEVYQPVVSPEGQPLLLEIYVRYESILSGGRALWMTFVPALVLALAVLFVVQVPLAIRLSRQLRARHREREELLRQALNASDAERRRIAAHLHDGVVQDLTALLLRPRDDRRHRLPPGRRRHPPGEPPAAGADDRPLPAEPPLGRSPRGARGPAGAARGARDRDVARV